MPDEMLEMYKAKSVHPRSGANCAWVPSPTAATIHAIHYHQIYVQSEQDKILNRDKASLNDLLKIPLIKSYEMPSAEEIQEELDNNAQGILGSTGIMNIAMEDKGQSLMSRSIIIRGLINELYDDNIITQKEKDLFNE